MLPSRSAAKTNADSQSGNGPLYARIHVSSTAAEFSNPMIFMIDSTVDPALRNTCSVRPLSRPSPNQRNHRELATCRKTLVQRNANPQMVAERALLSLREACAR